VTDGRVAGEEWFYAQGGRRNGPVSTEKMRELLATQVVDGETSIWRKGLPEWRALRSTELGDLLSDTPPPIAAADINNGLVWTLAMAPIGYLFLEIAILNYQLTHFGEDHSFFSAMNWLIPLLVNCALCLLDEAQLKRAGYNSGWMTLAALLLAPAYLFMRARRLRQKPTYAYVWVASFVISIFLQVA
jgi:hypothetical protein